MVRTQLGDVCGTSGIVSSSLVALVTAVSGLLSPHLIVANRKQFKKNLLEEFGQERCNLIFREGGVKVSGYSQNDWPSM